LGERRRCEKQRGHQSRFEPCFAPPSESLGGATATADLRQPPADAAPSADPIDSKLEQLKELEDLKASGVLTEAEFKDQKAKILAQ
jgi:hypothetical protein